MKPICLPLNELRPALAGLAKVTSKRPTLAVLGCVRVRRHDSGQVDLAVTDLDHAAVYSMDAADVAEPLTLLVPFADLVNIAKSCGNTGTIYVEPAGDTTAAIKFPVADQTIEHHCDLLPPEEFPHLPEIQGDSILLNDELRHSIHEAMECASTDASRPILNGACLDVSRPDAHYVVGTDGRHLFSANSFTLRLSQSVLLTEHKFIGWKGFNSDGGWRLKTQPVKDDEIPVFELASDHWRFTSRGVPGNYPNWKQVLPAPSAYQTTISIEPEAVEEAMMAVQRLPMQGDAHQSIGLEVAQGQFRLLGKSKLTTNWTRTAVRKVAVSGPDVTIFLDRTKLLKALRFGLARIDIIDAISPLRFSLAGRQMIVMPLRLETDVPERPQPLKPMPAETTSASPVPPEQPQPPIPTQPMQTATTNTSHTGAPSSVTTTTATATQGTLETKPALESALAQIEALKSGFRESITSLGKLGETVRQAIKEQKAGDKDLHSVRQTLRSLQSVRL